MKITVTNSVFPIESEMCGTIERLAKIGFGGVDLCLDQCANPKHPFNTDESQSYVNKLNDVIKKTGVDCPISHLFGEADQSPKRFEPIIKAISKIGTKISVLHPIWRIDDKVIHNDEQFLEINYKAFKEHLKTAEYYGVMLCTENILWGSSAKPVIADKLVEEIGSEYFGWCFDTGHANIFDIKPKDIIGLKHTPALLHIHDNHGSPEWDKINMHASVGVDEHLIPYDGIINWSEFLKTLKEINYKGVFNLEASHQAFDAEDKDRDKILSELLSRAKKMVKEYNSLK